MEQRVKMVVQKTRVEACVGWDEKCPLAYEPPTGATHCLHGGPHYEDAVPNEGIPDWCPLDDWEGDESK